MQADDARWMRKVIEQEHIKPLEVNKDYVLEYEKREKENQDRLASQVERHISTLKTLREKLESRHEMKTRTDEYRSWQREFSVKKQGVMIGKTLEEIEQEKAQAASTTGNYNNNSSSSSSSKRASGGSRGGGTATGAAGGGESSNELSNVLESLNKLAELESRITSLEKDNAYERIVQKERPAASDRTVMDFRKQRIPIQAKDADGGGGGGGGPVGVVYAMRPVKKSWQVQLPGTKKAAGTGVAAVRARQQQQQQRGGGGRGGDTFLTEGGDDYGYDADAMRRERLRKINDATPGQKNLRGRVQNKRGRAKEERLGGKRHEEALSELNRRRNEQQIQKRPPRGAAMATKGASAGIKSKNKHLQDFEKLKSNFKKKRENLTKKFGNQQTGGRQISQTAPSGQNGASGGGGGLGYRIPPTIRTGGTSTRRVEGGAPMRRGGGGAATAPQMVAGGVAMIRNLKAANAKGGTHY